MVAPLRSDRQPSDPLPAADLVDLARLRAVPTHQLGGLGRLVHAYRRGPGDRGFERIPMADAIARAGSALASVDGHRIGCLVQPGLVSDEDAYALTKGMVALGSGHIDTAGRERHAPMEHALLETTGNRWAPAAMDAVFEAQHIVLWGCPVDDLSPDVIDRIERARRSGSATVVDPLALAVASSGWSVLRAFRERNAAHDAQHDLQPRPGGDTALIFALLKWLIAHDRVDPLALEQAEGWPALRAQLDGLHLGALLDDAGLRPKDVDALAQRLSGATSVLSLVGPSFCVGPPGREAMRALVALHLALGSMGRPGTGVLSVATRLGGHGPALCGARPDAWPGFLSHDQLAQAWDLPIPTGDRHDLCAQLTPNALDAAILVGSPAAPLHPAHAEVLSALPLRVIFCWSLPAEALVGDGEVLLIPIAAPWERSDGAAVASFGRSIENIQGESPARAPSIWRTWADVVSRARPARAGHMGWHDADALRLELSKVLPSHTELPSLGDDLTHILYGDLCPYADGRFATENGRAQLVPPELLQTPRAVDQLCVASLHDGEDLPSVVLLSPEDAQRAGLQPGAKAQLHSEHGQVEAMVMVGPIRPGAALLSRATHLDPAHQPATYRLARLEAL